MLKRTQNNHTKKVKLRLESKEYFFLFRITLNLKQTNRCNSFVRKQTFYAVK